MSIKPSGVLPSKLNIPLLTPYHLLRERLDRRLADAAAMRAIVLRAPAGFGKTTVMLQYANASRAQGKAVAWLNLDVADNDIDRFLAHLERAVEAAAPRPSAASSEQDLLELVERIAASTQPFVLFFDEFEAIRNSAVLDVIRQVLEHMPPKWQIVIGSRIAPGLGLGRLRARGQILEIDLGQLRFSEEETRAFLCERRGLVLPAPLVDRLHRMTEGWATALWLASMALERHPDPEAFLDAFSGSNAAVDAFLAEEVLSKQPPAVREFLMRTSVLRQLSASLCDSVLERDDSAEVLAQLDQAGVFLIALDQAGHFRYHSLFAGFLSARLAREEPGAAGRLHLRAAQWYESAGWAAAAIEHALCTGERGFVIRLLDRHAGKLLDIGRFRLLARWLDRLRLEAIDQHPKLRVIHAWALAFNHRSREAFALMEQLEAEARETKPSPLSDEELRAHMLALRPVILIMLDKSEGAALELAIANHRRLDPSFGFPYSVLTNTLATLQGALNHYGEARALLDEARRSHFQIGSTFSLVIAECVEAGISLRQGRLPEAITRFRVATNHMALEARSRVLGHSLAAVQLAEALYEAGDNDEAARLLSVYLPLARELGLGDYLVRGYITLARLAWHRGEHELALRELNELEYHGRKDGLARLVVCAELERSRLALLRGDNLAAVAYLRRAEETQNTQMDATRVVPLHDVESVGVARLRLKVRAGETPSALAEALTEIPTSIETARRQECHRLALHLTLLWVEALQRSGQIAEARTRLVDALAQAAPQGFVRPFADEGPAVAALALSCWRAGAGSGRQQQSAFAAFGERLEAMCAGIACTSTEVSSGAAHPARAQGGLSEDLTVREVHVLKLLALGKTNSAIAEGLFVSENTVRTHMRNISAKLGARNRTEVVVRARELGLIA